MEINEDNFIWELEQKNEKALEYVIDNYAWILKTVIKKHLFSLPDFYEECMNDCLLGIWENIKYYNPQKSSFKNWIAGMAKYKSINYCRKYLRDLENKNIENIRLPVEDLTLKKILKTEIRVETERMLQHLSDENRKIFTKLYFEDKEIDEISNDTGLSKSVIYNRLSRGRKKIREAFSAKGGLR